MNRNSAALATSRPGNGTTLPVVPADIGCRFGFTEAVSNRRVAVDCANNAHANKNAANGPRSSRSTHTVTPISNISPDDIPPPDTFQETSVLDDRGGN
jgi:hypothetical protein